MEADAPIELLSERILVQRGVRVEGNGHTVAMETVFNRNADVAIGGSGRCGAVATSCRWLRWTRLLCCQRYIEFNPVRAGLVTDPGASAWRNYRGNAAGREDRRVTPHAVYLGLGADADSRRRLTEGYSGLIARRRH